MAYAPGSGGGGGGAPPGQQQAQIIIPGNIPPELLQRLTQQQREQLQREQLQREQHQRLIAAQIAQQTNGPGAGQQQAQQQMQQAQAQQHQQAQAQQQQQQQQQQQNQPQIQMNAQLLQMLGTPQGQNILNLLLMQNAMQQQQSQQQQQQAQQQTQQQQQQQPSQAQQQLLQQQLAQQHAQQQAQQQALQQAQQAQQAQQQAQQAQQVQQAHLQAIQQQPTPQQYAQLLQLQAAQQQQLQQLAHQQAQQQAQQHAQHQAQQQAQQQQLAQQNMQPQQVQQALQLQQQLQQAQLQQLQSQQAQQQQFQQLQQQQQLQQLIQQQQLQQQRERAAQAQAMQRPSVAPTPAPLAPTPQLSEQLAQTMQAQLQHQLQQQAHAQLLQQQLAQHQAQQQQQQAQQQQAREQAQAQEQARAQAQQREREQQAQQQHQPEARTLSQALQLIQTMQLQQSVAAAAAAAESAGNSNAESSQEEKLAQMLTEHQQQMIQNEAVQHRQMLIASTPVPRGGITMGTPISIARRSGEGPPTVSAHTPVSVRTPVAVQPQKQNSNPSINPCSPSTSSSSLSMLPAPPVMLIAPKPVDQPSSSKAASGNESMSDHINRIISENEVILQGDPVIRKKRPYHRQIGAQSSVDHDSNSGGSTRTSPGPKDNRMLQAASRSQSLFELSGSKNFIGSLTSGQPLLRPVNAQNDPNHTPECSYCKLTFSNEVGLQAHELVCGMKKEEEKSRIEKNLGPTSSQHPMDNPQSALKRRHTHQDATIAMQSSAPPAQAPFNLPGPSEPAPKIKKENDVGVLGAAVTPSASASEAQSTNTFPKSLPKEWQSHITTVQHLAAIIPSYIQAFLAKLLQTKLGAISEGSLRHIFEVYHVPPNAIQQFLHFASQLEDQQLEEMNVELEKTHMNMTDEHLENKAIQIHPLHELEIAEMQKQQEAMNRGHIPELLISVQALLSHLSGKRVIKNPGNTFCMIKLLHANGKDVTDIPYKNVTDLEECNERFVRQMRDIQTIVNMNNALLEALSSDDSVSATNPLFLLAREQGAILNFILRHTGMVHLTICASIAKVLGVGSLQQAQQQAAQMALENQRLQEDVQLNGTAPAPSENEIQAVVDTRAEDEDDDIQIEVVDEDQEREIAKLVAASHTDTNSRSEHIQQFLVPILAEAEAQGFEFLTDQPCAAKEGVEPNGHVTIANGAILGNGIALGDRANDEADRANPVNDILAWNIKDIDGSSERPYWLVIKEDVGGRPTFMASRGFSSKKDHSKNITSETYVTVPRQQPAFAEQEGTISMYANWALPIHNEAETKMNLSFMGQVSLKPRTGQHNFWKYTIANKDLGQYRMTHSSFWDISTKIRDRQASQSEESIEDQLQKLDPNMAEQIKELMSKDEKKRPEVAIIGAPEEIAGETSSAALPTHLLMRSPRPQTPVVIMHNDNESLEKEMLIPANVSSSQESPVVLIAKTENSDSRPTVITRDNVVRAQRDRPKYVSRMRPKHEQIIGGHRTDEVYVYVRGRGRGRYICDRCGIRCKKPSMLKKHIKSHTDVRAFNCTACNFSFKTKGNLTKHLSSKTHQRRIANIQAGNESDGTTPSTSSMMNMEDRFHQNEPLLDDYDNNSSDEEEYDLHEMQAEHKFKFGQEHILLERTAHTPPTRWMLVDVLNDEHYWPAPDRRSCMSAPPVAMQRDPDDRAITPSESGTPQVAHAPPSPLRGNLVSYVVPPQQFDQVQSSSSSILAESSSTGNQDSSFSSLVKPVLPTNSATIPNFDDLLQKDETLNCDQCDRTFRKPSDLNLHQLTHNIEKQQSKNRMYQCTECRIPLRTKSLLSKHLETVHGVHMDESVQASIDPLASTQSVLGGPSSNNPRSFMCVDCDIGFRKHGILAKHLRSKTHVMKLESLQRLPVDTLSLITKKDNGACLNDIDTSDCEKARISLLNIVEKLRNEPNQHDEQHVKAAGGTVALTPEMLRALATAQSQPAASFPMGVVSAASVSAVLATSSQSNVSCVSSFINSNMSPIPTVLPPSQVLPQPTPPPPHPSPLESSSALFRKSREVSESCNLLRPLLRISEVSPVLHNTSPISKNDSKTVPRSQTSASSPLLPSSTTINPLTVLSSYRKRSEPLIAPGHSGPNNSFGLISMPAPSKRANIWTPPNPPPRKAEKHPVRPHSRRPKPIPDTTKCPLCMENLPNPIELQVHLHVDHIRMMDGAEYKCPRKHCGLNYNCQENLRAHVRAHYESDHQKLLDEKTLLTDAIIFPTDRSKALKPMSPKKDSGQTSFKSILEHHETYNQPGPSSSTSQKTPGASN